MGRPAHTTCLRGRRERKRSSLARFDCRRKREHGSQFVHILNLFSSVTLLKPTVTAAMLARQNWHLCLFFCLCASTQGEPWPIPCTPPRRSSAVKIVATGGAIVPTEAAVIPASSCVQPNLSNSRMIKNHQATEQALPWIDWVALRVVCHLGSSVGWRMPQKALWGLTLAKPGFVQNSALFIAVYIFFVCNSTRVCTELFCCFFLSCSAGSIGTSLSSLPLEQRVLVILPASLFSSVSFRRAFFVIFFSFHRFLEFLCFCLIPFPFIPFFLLSFSSSINLKFWLFRLCFFFVK